MYQEVKESSSSMNYEKVNFSNDFNESNMNMGTNGVNMVCPGVCEMPRERVCHRYFCYEVPHIVPCNTRIINHHIYKHKYVPEYTCCEENECSNVYENCQNNFF